MEWNGGRASRTEGKAKANRILTVTSGNIQPAAAYAKRHVDKQMSSVSYRSYSANHFSKPSAPSNDRHLLHRQKLNTRRLKRRARLAEKYLYHPKFLEYQSRSRRDVSRNNQEVIWSEETETAFQNAIINIPAMGRRKKSQHGKTLGRNELIMEWIKQETGKTRDRKQVSSHMQTLDKMFAPKPEEGIEGVPEWRIINKGPDGSMSEHDEPEFYENSIADMVRTWRTLQRGLVNSDVEVSEDAATTQFQPEWNHRQSVNEIRFEMWVSLPDQMEEALHRYTRIQSSQAAGPPELLENIPNWRTNWPALSSLIEHSQDNEIFDLILLDANFELMLDFPPPKSKLASSLELDFTDGNRETRFADSRCWKCTTYIYQRGKLEANIEHNQCHVSAPGRVKPPFESRWWAEQLTRLTEKRRRALDSGSDAAVAIADETARNYLSNLKIMQLISLDLSPTQSSMQQPGRKRIAILLWSFSQVSPLYIGTTTWRRLVHPNLEDTSTYPDPPINDSMVLVSSLGPKSDPTYDLKVLGSNLDFVQGSLHPEGDEVCQDGYMMITQQTLFLPTEPSFDTLQYMYHNDEIFQSNAVHTHSHEIFHQPTTTGQVLHDRRMQHVITNGTSSQAGRDLAMDIRSTERPDYTFLMNDDDPAALSDRRHALLSFDSNTHKMLQMQLEAHAQAAEGDCPNPISSIESQQTLQKHIVNRSANTVKGVRSLILAGTTNITDARSQSIQADGELEQSGIHNNFVVQDGEILNNLDRQVHYGEQLHHTEINRSVTLTQAPKAVRPMLHHHHTFHGVLPMDSAFDASLPSDPLLDMDDIVIKHDFALLLDSLHTGSEELFSNDHALQEPLGLPPENEDGHATGLGIVRSQSQPLPVSGGKSIDQHSTQIGREHSFDVSQGDHNTTAVNIGEQPENILNRENSYGAETDDNMDGVVEVVGVSGHQ